MRDLICDVISYICFKLWYG